MKETRKYCWLSPAEWVVVIVITALIVGLVASRLRYTTAPQYPYNILDKVMGDIYHQMLAGKNHDQIMRELSSRERTVVAEMKVTWRPDLLLVNTTKGRLKTQHLPEVNHVVLYAVLGNKSKPGGIAETVYYSAQGEKSCASVVDLQRYIRMTEKGVEGLRGKGGFDIDMSGVSRDLDENQRTQFLAYVVLRLLIDGDAAFLERCVELAAKGDYRTNGWLADLLQSAITAPRLPELHSTLTQADEFRRTLSEWWEKNSGHIEISNAFLFKDLKVDN